MFKSRCKEISKVDEEMIKDEENIKEKNFVKDIDSSMMISVA